MQEVSKIAEWTWCSSTRALPWGGPIIFGGQEEIAAVDWLNALEMGNIANRIVSHFTEIKRNKERYNLPIVLLFCFYERRGSELKMDKEWPRTTKDAVICVQAGLPNSSTVCYSINMTHYSYNTCISCEANSSWRWFLTIIFAVQTVTYCDSRFVVFSCIRLIISIRMNPF